MAGSRTGDLACRVLRVWSHSAAMPLRLLLCVAAVVLGLVSGALSVSASSPYNPFEPIYPTISSDGKQLAWVEGSTWRVWVGSPDGSGAHVFGPSFANGIGQIAWTRLGIVVDSNYTLFLLTADGKRKKIASVADQEFSTGGNRVAVGGGQGGGPLTVVDLGTRKTTRFGAGTPALSPDGRRVGWASTSGVWVATSSGAHAHRIAVAGGCLAWSPNSRSLAYLTSKGNGNQLDLAVTSAAGGTTRTVAEQLTGCNLAWSPDGKAIALASARLVVVSLSNGSVRRSPTRIGRDAGGFAWSHDGKALYLAARPFADETAGNNCTSLWRLDARSLSATTLARGCS
jgi:sugar lactone lactonase YvrE